LIDRGGVAAWCVAPDEHDAVAWFTEDALGELSLAHDSYLAIFSKVLAEHRA
jgi:hypothetical protein